MNKKKNNIDLLNKITDLCLWQKIGESNLYLISLNKQIKLYQRHLEFLRNNKPSSFQKKKIIEYNNKLNEYSNKINILYDKLSDELKFIEQSCINICNTKYEK